METVCPNTQIHKQCQIRFLTPFYVCLRPQRKNHVSGYVAFEFDFQSDGQPHEQIHQAPSVSNVEAAMGCSAIGNVITRNRCDGGEGIEQRCKSTRLWIKVRSLIRPRCLLLGIGMSSSHLTRCRALQLYTKTRWRHCMTGSV